MSQPNRREVTSEFERAALERWNALGTVTDRVVHYNEGFEAGSMAAISDFLDGEATAEVGDKVALRDDLSDHFKMGFEVGYLKKLVDILLN